MDLVFELLEDPAYRHILSNHLPVTGLAFAWVVLVWGTVEGRWRSVCFGLSLVLMTSASAVFVMETGDDAYPAVYDMLDGTGRAWLDHHTLLADQWGRVLIANGVIAAAAIGLGGWRESWRRPVAIGVLATTLASLFAAVAIAEAGGKIRHPEFRFSDPPVSDTHP